MTKPDVTSTDPPNQRTPSLAGELKHAFKSWRRSPGFRKDPDEIERSKRTERSPRGSLIAPNIVDLTRCIECGYPLHGLSPFARCPECGITRAEAKEAMAGRVQDRVRELVVGAGAASGLVIAVEFGLPLPIVLWNLLPVFLAFLVARGVIRKHDGRWLEIPATQVGALIGGTLVPIGVIVFVHLYWLMTSGIASTNHPDGVLIFFVLPAVATVVGVVSAVLGYALARSGLLLYIFTVGSTPAVESAMGQASTPPATTPGPIKSLVTDAFDQGDARLLAMFEARTWPIEKWHHREHVKIAYLYLSRYPFDITIEKMRKGIKAYNAANEVPESQESGYHETLTQGFMRLIHMTIQQFGPAQSADAFVDKHTQLLSKRALLFFYSRNRIMSLEAKEQFIEPDLTPFPQYAPPSEPDSMQSGSMDR